MYSFVNTGLRMYNVLSTLELYVDLRSWTVMYDDLIL